MDNIVKTFLSSLIDGYGWSLSRASRPTDGIQLREVKQHLRANGIKYVWFDWWCMWQHDKRACNAHC